MTLVQKIMTLLNCHKLKQLFIIHSTIIILSGCADCSIFAASTPACSLQIGALAVVTLPILLPYSYIKAAKDDHAAAEAEKRLRADVEAGNIPASEYCLFECSRAYRELKEDRWRVRQVAAKQVLQEYSTLTKLSPRQQAINFSALDVMSASLAKSDPTEAQRLINTLLLQGESTEMWRYINQDSQHGNELPVNNGYFNDIVLDVIVRQLLRSQQAISSQTENNATKEFNCDLSSYQSMLKLSRNSEHLVCDIVLSRQTTLLQESEHASVR